MHRRCRTSGDPEIRRLEGIGRGQGFYLTGSVDFLGYRYTSSSGIESNSQGNSCMGEAGGVFFRLVGFNPVVTIPGVDPLLWVVPAFFLGFESGQIDALTPTGALPVLPPFGPINGGIVGRCLNPPGCFQQPSFNGRFEATRAVVPEPATLSLVGAGLIAAWLRGRRSHSMTCACHRDS